MSQLYTKLDIQNRLATITLNRPEKRNAFNYELVDYIQIDPQF